MNLKIIIRWGVSHFLNLWNWRQQIGESLHISLLRLGRVWVIENRYQDTHWLFSLSFVPKMSRISGQDDMILDSWWQPCLPLSSLTSTRVWHCAKYCLKYISHYHQPDCDIAVVLQADVAGEQDGGERVCGLGRGGRDQHQSWQYWGGQTSVLCVSH